MSNLNQFTGLYPVSKTLCFELKPQGRTLEHIKNKGIIKQDEHRAESYIKVKKIIDDYHKLFIDKALQGCNLTLLQDYLVLYKITKRDDAQNKKFEETQENLRIQIASRFIKHDKFKTLFSKELIKIDLKTFVKTEEELDLLSEFDNFTTYFTGFHENRSNMYSSEDKSTAIAYRLIHQNLPKFIDNIDSFIKVSNSAIKENFGIILSELESIVQVKAIEDVFTLNYFNETLTQLGIDKYNILIGGYTSEDGKVKIKGLNEYINIYNQKAKKEDKLPKLKPLYKQILSDRVTASYIPEEFKNDSEVLTAINKFYQELNENVINKKELSLKTILQNLSDYDLTKIYLKNDSGLTDLSKKMFGEWDIFTRAMNVWYRDNYLGRLKLGTMKYEEEQKKYFRNQDSFSIKFLDDCLLLLDGVFHKKVEDYFRLLGVKDGEKIPDLIKRVESNYQAIQNLLNSVYPDSKTLSQDQKSVDGIKDFLDSIKDLQQFIKPMLGKGTESEKDNRFYSEFLKLWEILNQITVLYDKVRNYVTKKPYSTEKIKLNFENSTLMAGWDVNKETDNTAVIFRKYGLYYLGIMDKKHNRIFSKDLGEDSNGHYYEKMNYKLLPGANKMLPHVFLSNSGIEKFKPNSSLLINYKDETHKRGDKFNLQHCHDLIDYFKKSINAHEDWKNFNFEFSDTDSYSDLSEFYKEVEIQGYKITYRKISESYINQMVDEGKLYLFQLYSKDFSVYGKGTPNMHTIYWKMLFDPENLENVVYKLSGEAEIFYRKASIKESDKIVHRANQPINNKNSLNAKEQSTFGYDIIKDRRYTVDKFLFHVPVVANFKAPKINNINNEVNTFIKNSDDLHIIGIDRGERNLLYLTLIDLKGNIKQQFSLNEIINECHGNTYKTNYHDLLDRRETERDESRKNWKSIESIKDLKDGYLSQVIHKISELMIKYNAIVVLEDLELGFIQGRQKIEKQVYQKFEKMLIDKLNYLVVDKNIEASEFGGALKAYQLTNKFESFQKMGKQSGFLFYVPAWNTSKIDPVTGFVNMFDTRYENIEKAKAFFNKFESIRYNKDKDYFEFSVTDYSKFNPKAIGTKQNWLICTNGNRIETFRNNKKSDQWDNREIVLSYEFKKIFKEFNVDIGSDIKDAISNQTDKRFFENLLHLFKLTLQIRNSISGTEIDYLISPVMNDSGVSYDSRVAENIFPKDADANGAYNTARKGLMAVNRIKGIIDLKKLDLYIKNKEWLVFAQNFSGNKG
jgi:CRISPR-associated protein Cpf1